MTTHKSRITVAVATAVLILGLTGTAMAQSEAPDNDSETAISSQQARYLARHFMRDLGYTAWRTSSNTASIHRARLVGDTWLVSVRYGGRSAFRSGTVAVDAATGAIRSGLIS